MADGKFIAQSPGNTKVYEKKDRMQKEECWVGMIAPTGGVSVHRCEAHLIWCNRGGEDIRNLHVGSRVEISVKVIGTAACFVASRPDP